MPRPSSIGLGQPFCTATFAVGGYRYSEVVELDPSALPQVLELALTSSDPPE